MREITEDLDVRKAKLIYDIFVVTLKCHCCYRNELVVIANCKNEQITEKTVAIPQLSIYEKSSQKVP